MDRIFAPNRAVLFLAASSVLLAGCSGPSTPEDESFIFTENDLALFDQLSDEPAAESGSVTDVTPLASGSGAAGIEPVVLDVSNVPAFRAMRQAEEAGYTVTNIFLNVREQPSVQAAIIGRYDRGDAVNVQSIVDGTWAEVRMSDGRSGYVAHEYLAKYVSPGQELDDLSDGRYFVHFAYVNMRAEPSQDSEKIREIPGQAIVRPDRMENGWAHVSFEGAEGWISADYIRPLQIDTVVRQDEYRLPVLQYRLSGSDDAAALSAMQEHVRAIRGAGIPVIALRDFYAVLQRQEQGGAPFDGSAVLTVSGITPQNIRAVSDALNEVGVDATLFIETRHLGISGITEKTLLTMRANGFDIQSATHTGDDLRALTNAQAELELRQSRKLLEEYTGQPIFAVAWPRGGVNDRIRDIAEEAGYLFGVADGAKVQVHRSDLLSIPAMAVLAGTTTEDVLRFVSPEAVQDDEG